MPILSITNSTTGDLVIQDPTGNSTFEVKVPASSTKNGVKVTAAQMAAIEAELNKLQTASKLTWSAAPDFTDPAENAVGTAKLRHYLGLGNNGVGHVTMASAKVGDLVLWASNLTALTDVSSSFEAKVTVAGQVQQTAATDLSAAKIEIVLQPQS